MVDWQMMSRGMNLYGLACGANNPDRWPGLRAAMATFLREGFDGNRPDLVLFIFPSAPEDQVRRLPTATYNPY